MAELSKVNSILRRVFLRRSSILLVSSLSAVAFLGGCEDDPLANSPQGTLRVIVSGQAPTSANAGEIRYTADNFNIVLPIPAAGVLEQSVPAGTYLVLYVPPTGHTLAAGQEAQRNITINADALTEVSFNVVPPQSTATGVLRVTVTGLASGAGSGGSATAERTDISGQAPVSINVPTTGNADVQVTPGTYRVTYAPPMGYQLASGQTNPRTATVTQNTTSAVSFQVQAASSGSAVVLFYSDWRTRTGNTDDAISDGGKWNFMTEGAGQNGSIIDAPTGFSTHKVLRVQTNGYRDGWLAPTVTTLGQIPVGSTRNYRWEHAFHEPALGDAGQHPIQDGGSASQSNFYLSTVNGGGNLAAGQWALEWGFWGNGDWNRAEFVLGAREGQWTPLQKGQVYRIEVQIVRVSTSQFRFHSWIHNAAGTLLYDDDDFHSRDGAASLASNPLQNFNNPANGTNFLVGLNGISNGASPVGWPVHSSDQAAVAIVQGLSEGQQIGAYGSVQGEVRR